MTQFPELPAGPDPLDRVLASAATPQTTGSGELPRLEALLAAAAAPSESGPQPGEQAALAAFRELVTEQSGTPSLAGRRHRRRMAVVALTSTVAMLGGGVAAAATDSLPGAAQSTAKTVLGALGVHVPGPNDAGDHPNQRGRSGTHTPTSTPSVTPTQPAEPDVLTPTHPDNTPPTPGNAGPARHHGNPTPTATAQPLPGHGKPTQPPAVSHRRTPTPSSKAGTHPRVTRGMPSSINR